MMTPMTNDTAAAGEERPPSFQALYNRYRPQRFAGLVGQGHVVRTLQNALVHNRLSHAYMFSGERGTGKTTAARLLAKAVNCLEGVQSEPCEACDHCQAIATGSFLDLIEMDAASHRGIDDIREIRDLTQFAPASGRYRVYIIDEVHQLSLPAKDALLKTLEEPPPQTLFVLATTEPHRVPATIRSRTQHLVFRRIGVLELTAKLREIAEQEGAKIDDAALRILARNGGGSARDSVSLLDQALAYGDNTATAATVNAMLGLTGRDAVVDLVRHLLRGDTAAGLLGITQAVEGGVSPTTLHQQVIDLLRDLLLLKASPEAGGGGHLTDDERHELAAQTDATTMRDVVRALDVFAAPAAPSRTGVDASLELELAYARAALTITETAAAPAAAAAVSPPAPARPPQAERPASAPPPRPAPPAAAGGDSSEALSAELVASRKDEWLALVQQESRAIAPYVKQAEVMRLDDGTVTLGYRSSFLLDRVEQTDALRLVTNALGQTFGRPLNVRNELRRAAPAAERPAAAAPRADDPVVRVAMREFGATPIMDQTDSGA